MTQFAAMEYLHRLFSRCTLLLFLYTETLIASDTITRNQSLTGNKTLVSSGQRFELGFFSPGKSSNWYLGLWYKNLPIHTVVWVANRNNPLEDSSGMLTINENGVLVLLNQTGFVKWSSLNHSSAHNPIAQLLDSGNLVLKYAGQDDPMSYIWQSFDHPTDSLLAGMKFGWDLRTGRQTHLTSWKNSGDPSEGEYTYRLEPQGFPQIFLRRGLVRQYRFGQWNGLRFSGTPDLSNNPVFTPIFVNNIQEVYYAFSNKNNSVPTRLVVQPSGLVQRVVWNDRIQEWSTMLTIQKDQCDNYALCGVYATCSINEVPICQCLKGFMPKSPKAWEQIDWSDGCMRRAGLDCSDDIFIKYTSVKLPYSPQIVVNTSMTLEECRAECLKNCSCMAYTNSDLGTPGRGCVLWFGNLIDIRNLQDGGQDLYMRMAKSEQEETTVTHKRKKSAIVIVLISVASGILLLVSAAGYFIWKTWKERQDKEEKGNLDLPLYGFATIATATNNFSSDNKLGEGGFGSVYKGELLTGQLIAVKRLSEKSGQGLDEFKNEVLLIVKLQHRNLVRLLGCCIQKDEKMLIYEYMSNNSLDSILFDRAKSKVLNWEKRFQIVVGIAQGVLYLHTYSRLRIIHRDLKASNILLDAELNPKISDFGMARTFGGEQTEAKTRRVVGTYGYMSPEYATDGRFSMKSDVFSFGVLVLEIVSGKKNRGFRHPDHDLNLLGYAWQLWNEGKALELVDASLEDQLPESQVLKLIQVGLLCVQQRPDDRPNMLFVVSMLCTMGSISCEPKEPGFYYERSASEENSMSTGGNEISSTNKITVTLIQGR